MEKQLHKQLLVALILMLASLNRVQAQCPGTCTYTQANGPNINLNGNQTLCITANTGDLFINFNGSNNVICVAPGVTWTQTSGLNLSSVTINVFGTWNLNGSLNVNSTSTINIEPGATMNTNSSGFSNNLTINNDGTMNFTNTGNITFTGNTFSLNNSATGIVNAMSTTSFFMGNGTTFDNYGVMNLANAENEEGYLTIRDGATFKVSRLFNNHGAFIIEPSGKFMLPCETLPGAAGATICSFRVGDKGVGKEFINNSCCFEVAGNVTFDGATTNNGRIIISNGNLTINKPSTGTNGRIVVVNGTSTIALSANYAGTNLTFCDQNTAGNNFDNIQNNPASNLYTVDCTVTTSCCTVVACTNPAATFTTMASTCTGATQNNNGTISVATQSNATHYGVSTAGAVTYNGPTTIATATAMPANGTTIVTAVAHTGATYIIRVFNGADNCFIDIPVTVAAGPTCTVSCPTITNPSAAQNICEGLSGTNITIQTNQNAANGIRFVRFSTDQSATNGSETPTELAAIYAGSSVLATVTPTGASSPYTATLTTAAAGWSTLTPGVYYVYAILNPDPGASCRPVQEIIVTVNAAPTPTITGPTVLCAGENLTLTAGTGYTTYTWSNGGGNAVTANYSNVTASTTYTVTVSNSAGCTATDTHQVTVNALPLLTTINGLVCKNGSIDLSALVTNSGGGALSYHNTLIDAQSGVNPLASAIVMVNAARHYYVRSQTSSGCYAVKQITVTIAPENCGLPAVSGPN